MENKDKLLEVNDLKTYFDTRRGLAKAVDGVSFDLYKGETLGIVGESGCGKSITSLSILNLVPQPKGKIYGGEIKLRRHNGEVVDITKLKRTGKKMKDIRRKDTAM